MGPAAPCSIDQIGWSGRRGEAAVYAGKALGQEAAPCEAFREANSALGNHDGMPLRAASRSREGCQRINEPSFHVRADQTALLKLRIERRRSQPALRRRLLPAIAAPLLYPDSERCPRRYCSQLGLSLRGFEPPLVASSAAWTAPLAHTALTRTAARFLNRQTSSTSKNFTYPCSVESSKSSRFSMRETCPSPSSAVSP
jgi:hypothetical protein